MSELLLERAGRRRSPATLPGFHAGHAPGNDGLRYPADPPKVEEIIAVMRAAGGHAHGQRLRALIVILWRAGRRRIQQALARGRRSRSAPRLAPGPARQARTPPRGRHRRVGLRTTPPLARHAARAFSRSPCSAPATKPRADVTAACAELRRTAAAAGIRRRFAPHQLRHAHAVEIARNGVAPIVIQRQLGDSNLGITSVHLQRIDSGEIIETVHARRAPMIPVSATPRP
jgi:integrase